MKLERIALGLLLPLFGYAAEDTQQPEAPSIVKLENIEVKAVFPGYEGSVPVLTNGEERAVEFYVENKESKPVTIGAMGGGFYERTKKKTGLKAAANLTTTEIGTHTIKAGEKYTIKHSLLSTLPPLDFDLKMFLLGEYEEQVARIEVEPIAVSVEDPPISIFDPKLIFVQIILGLTLSGIVYVVGTTYLKPYLEPKKKAHTSSSEASSKKVSGVKPNEKGYDESWIPENHLKKVNGGKKKK